MKKIFLSLLILTSVISHPTSAYALTRPVNQGFESSLVGPFGYSFWDGTTGGSTYTIATASGERHSGRAAIKVQIGPNPGQYGATTSLEQTLRTSDYAGKTIRFSAWCKTTNGGKAYLKISITHASGARDTYWRPSVTPLTDCPTWKKLETPWVQIPADVTVLELEEASVGANGTIWFDDYSLETETPLPIIIPDQRFGYGGNPQIAKDLNIPWFYNWSTGTFPEEKAFFTVGKIECATINLTALKEQGLKDDEDRSLYDRLDVIAQKFEGKPLQNGLQRGDYGGSNVCAKADRPRQTFLQIGANLANAFPGSYYQIGNEVDWYPYFTPEDYAEWYNVFYRYIKKYDPSAHVMAGGLLPLVYSNPSYLSHDESNNYHWIDVFRNSYKDKFGSFPTIDVWAIHPYGGLDWENSTKKTIVDFRDIYLTRIGEAKKPIWLTEFGILALEGGVYPGVACSIPRCLSAADHLQEWNIIANQYMKPLITWLKSNDYAQKWFWFYAGQTTDWNPSAVNYIGDTYLTPNGEYNPMGLAYKQLAEEGAERIPNCSITSGPAVVTLGETANYSASFFSAQGNLGTRISIGRNGNFLEDINGNVSNQSSTAATGNFAWTPKTAGTFDLFCRAWNDGIAECRGNTAYVDGLPRYECAGPKAFMTVKVISPIPGDLNKDHKLDLFDYNLFVSEYNQTGSKPSDLNKSGKVDNLDYTLFIPYFK